ncbi:MAG: hypothetical protein ACRD3T_13340 [Terriglobia bacterium]
MGIHRRGLFLLTLAVICAAPAIRQSLLLDLTTPAVARYERSLAGHCVSGGIRPTNSESKYTPPALPLRVQILSVDRKSYQVGEAVRGTIRLTNTGNVSIPVPWSLNPDIVEGKDCSWPPLPPGAKPLHGSVTIWLVDGAGNLDPIGSHYLFGATSNGATYRNLAPNQSLEIRMMSRIDVSYLNEQRLKEKRKVLALPANLKAVGSFEYNDVPWFGEYPEVHSADSIPITVTGQ